ncbi:MAG: pyridoxamine 5'-phosphate oxidase family protein [Anaerolineae bacterium]
MNLPHTDFSEADIAAFMPEMKIGLLATVNDKGLPHLTLISTLRASSPTQLTWGQFTEGLSKQHIQRHPQVGFMVMTLNKEVWRGKATFTHTARQGADYDAYNNIPMFRYNAYFGIHTVYYMDLVAHTGRQVLPMGQVIFAAVQTILARTLAHKHKIPVLNLWTRRLLNKLDNLKFLAYVDTDGYPVIIPVIQAQALDTERVIFSAGAFGDELRAIPAGVSLAVFGMTLDMEDVLLRGTFEGVRRIGGMPCGTVKVDWVYNPMPPKPEQIYPAVPLEPVRIF